MKYIDSKKLTWAKNTLTTAQREFAKHPTSMNWNLCLKAMFTHQQLQWASISPSIDREKLSLDLDNKPMGEWQNVICIATLGYPVREALKEYGLVGC